MTKALSAHRLTHVDNRSGAGGRGRGHKEIAIEMEVALSELIAGKTRKPDDDDETCLAFLSRCRVLQNIAELTLKGSKTYCVAPQKILSGMERNEWELDLYSFSEANLSFPRQLSLSDNPFRNMQFPATTQRQETDRPIASRPKIGDIIAPRRQWQKQNLSTPRPGYPVTCPSRTTLML